MYEGGSAPPPKATPFYRIEVMTRHRGAEGELLIGIPNPWKISVLIGAVFIILLLSVGFLMPYSQRQTVSGWLVPTGGLVQVSARYGGVVETANGADGQHVTSGQTLARLRLSANTNFGDAGNLIEAATTAQLLAQQRSAHAAEQKLQIDRAELLNRVALLQAQRVQAVKNIKLYEDAENLTKNSLDRILSLSDKGYVSKQALDNAKTNYLSSQQNVLGGNQAILGIDQQIADARSQIAAMPQLVAQAKADAAVSMASAQSTLEQARAAHQYSLISPVNGQITAASIAPGQEFSTGQIAYTIVPENEPLEIQLFVPSSAVGLIKPGDDVALHYRAFPYEKYGAASGKVISVSKSIIPPGTDMPKGIDVTEGVFKVRVRPDKLSVSLSGEKIPLKVGMVVDADVIVAKQAAIAWLLQPVFSIVRR